MCCLPSMILKIKTEVHKVRSLRFSLFLAVSKNLKFELFPSDRMFSVGTVSAEALESWSISQQDDLSEIENRLARDSAKKVRKIHESFRSINLLSLQQHAGCSILSVYCIHWTRFRSAPHIITNNHLPKATCQLISFKKQIKFAHTTATCV